MAFVLFFCFFSVKFVATIFFFFTPFAGVFFSNQFVLFLKKFECLLCFSPDSSIPNLPMNQALHPLWINSLCVRFLRLNRQTKT